MHPLFAATFLLVWAAPASAAQIGFGDNIKLPCSGLYADHATVEANSYGDICVAFQSGLASGSHQVEVQIVHNVAPGTWQSSLALHYVLGDPGLNVFGNGNDSCNKPDVVALDDESFVVVWPRHDLSNPALGRLETARFEVRDAAGLLLPAPVLSTAAPGEGFIADPAVPAGDGGIMPDLAAMPGGIALAVYAAEDSKTFGTGGETYREYSLRLTQMNWGLGPTHPGFLEGPWVLANRIPLDNPWWAPYSGGLVLPDVVTDDLDNIVVAWEQYWVSGHPAYGGGDLGEIVVRRYAATSSATPRSSLDEDHFFTTFGPYRHQRRPNLATTGDDAVNDVLLAWADLYDPPWHDKVRVRSIHYPSSMAIDQSWADERYWGGDPFHDETHPDVGMLPGREFCFATRTYLRQRAMMGANNAAATMFQVPTKVGWPLRPSVKLVRAAVPGGGTTDALIMTYEGANTDLPTIFRTYLGIFRL